MADNDSVELLKKGVTYSLIAMVFSAIIIFQGDLDNCDECDSRFVEVTGDRMNGTLNISVDVNSSDGLLIIENINNGTGATSEVEFYNDLGHAGSIFATSSQYTGIADTNDTFGICSMNRRLILASVGAAGLEIWVGLPPVAWVNISGDGKTTFQDGVDTIGNLTVNESFRLTNTAWDDERVPVTATRVPASRNPSFEQFKDDGASSQGVFSYAFSPSAEQELYFALQLSHRYKPGTDILPHVHYANPDGNAGNVTWGLEYTCIEINGTFLDTNIINVTNPNEGADFHSLLKFPPINGVNLSESAMCINRIFRDATDDSDTYGSDSFLFEIDFHYEVEKLGTDNEFPNN